MNELVVPKQTLKLTQYDPITRRHVEVFPDTIDIEGEAVMFYEHDGKFYTVPDADWREDIDRWLAQWGI